MIKERAQTLPPRSEFKFFEILMEVFAHHLLELRIQSAALTLVEIEEQLAFFAPNVPIDILERLVEAHEVLLRLRMNGSVHLGLAVPPPEFATQH